VRRFALLQALITTRSLPLLAAGELLPLLPATLPATVTAALGTSASPSEADALQVDHGLG
jgi:hypothetical protein